MANEILFNASLAITDATSPTRALQTGDVTATIANDNQIGIKFPVLTTLTAVPVFGLVAPGWAIFVNRDPTNTIDLYTDNGANKKRFAVLPPGGGAALLQLGLDAQAPYAQARVATCQMEILVLDS